MSRPLYFQHDGHSRTIVGIQVKHQPKGSQYNLLILDPGHVCLSRLNFIFKLFSCLYITSGILVIEIATKSSTHESYSALKAESVCCSKVMLHIHDF